MHPKLFEWMSLDCTRLLTQISRRSKKRFQTPAQALPEVVRMMGYKIVWSSQVPENVYAFTNFDRREVVLAKDLKQRLSHPASLRGVVYACLAHELGHIRMHAHEARKGKRSVRWESEAHAYSGAFLVPHREVLSEPETQVLLGGLLQDQESMWKQVLRLAERYQVNGSFMACALNRYGVLRFCPRTRKLQVSNVLMRRATRIA